MNFEEALTAMRNGKIVKLDEILYSIFMTGMRILQKEIAEDLWIDKGFNPDNLLRNDWEIYKEKKITLEEAIAEMRKGKVVKTCGEEIFYRISFDELRFSRNNSSWDYSAVEINDYIDKNFIVVGEK